MQRDCGLLTNCCQLEFSEHKSERFGCANPAHPAAVAHNASCFVGPLKVHIIQRVLKRTWKGVVVFGDDKHITIKTVDQFAPCTRVRVLVLLMAWISPFVKIAEIVVGKVNQLKVCAAAGMSLPKNPRSDLISPAPRPSTAENDCNSKFHATFLS